MTSDKREIRGKQSNCLKSEMIMMEEIKEKKIKHHSDDNENDFDESGHDGN